MATILISLLLILLVMGFPIFIATAIPGFVAIKLYMPYIPDMIFAQRMTGSVSMFTLLAIPFFIFAAEIMSQGQIGQRLIDLCEALVGHIRGGLAITTIFACLIFGAISGAGVAGIVSIGKIVYPSLIKTGYGKKFSLGLVISSSTLAMLIPPGISMVLYSILANSSVGEIFLSGISVGVLLGITFAIYSYIYAKKKNIQFKERANFSEIKEKIKKATWALGMPVILLGGIYLGFYTPTEAAAVSVVYAAFVEIFIYKDLSFKQFIEVCRNSARITAMIMILIAAGSLLAWAVTVGQISQSVVNLIHGWSPFFVIIFINVIFLIAGMFIDPNSAMIILVPLVFPIAIALDINLIQLGIIIVLNMAIGMLSPPFGLNLFVGRAIFKEPFEEIIPGVLPFIILTLFVLGLISFIPAISLWLPNLLLL